MGTVVAVARSRWTPALVALVLGVALGPLVAPYGINKDGSDVYISSPPAEFDSPSVVDMPVPDAIDRLVDAGYRVVAVGDGKVKLQELGFRGSVLRIQGWEGTRLRYCTARLPGCVRIDEGFVR
jgi:hypothetical protein